jgi:tRNA pseudouridine38-40 synthase
MRIALGIEYDGTDFLGWQRLSHGASVQGCLEQALSFVAAEPIAVTCAGRTDAGVHGRCQVVHFDTEVQRDMRSWVLGACSNLPTAVAVLWAQPIDDAFHARFSARSRRYRYTILNRAIRPALDARYVAWERLALDASRMHAAAQVLIGEHDFSAFRAVSCQANAFLHHMVRNIVGSLLVVGRGEQPETWIAELLAGRNREVAGPTAAASGLTFIGPRYERRWGLPAEVSE